jgi:hypothetical protein
LQNPPPLTRETAQGLPPEVSYVMATRDKDSVDKKQTPEEIAKTLAGYGIKLTCTPRGAGKYSFNWKQTAGGTTTEFPLKATTEAELQKFVEPIISVASKLKDAKEKYGIDIAFTVDGNGKFRFHEKAAGDLRAKTPVELERYLKPLIEAKSKELEKRQAKEKADAEKRDALGKELEKTFQVSFSKDGEKVKYRGKDVECRAPTLAEMEALSKALYRGQPSHLLTNGKPLRIEIFTEQMLKGAVAFRSADRIVIQPSAKNEGTELRNADAYRGPGSRGNTLIATILHELAHNTQARLDKDFDFLADLSPQQSKLAERIGFRNCVPEKSDEAIWLLEARTKTDGKTADLFRRLPGEADTWARCDEKGAIITKDKDGKRTPVERISGIDMRLRAKFTMPTSYNSTPSETMAEALTCLRLGGESVKAFIRDCPEIYAIAREIDKQDIMKTYGTVKGDDKEASHIRNEAGQLVVNTAKSRAAFRDFEEALRKAVDKKAK